MSIRMPTSQRLLLGVLAMLPPVILAITVAIRADGATDQWAALFVISLLLLVPVLYAVLVGRFDPLEPIYIVNAAYLLYFVYAPAEDLLEGREYFFGIHVSPLLIQGMVVLGAGLVAMLVGYYLRAGRDLAGRTPRPTTAYEGATTYAVILAAIAVFAFGSWVQLSGMTWLRLMTFGQLGGGADPGVMANADDALANYMFGTLDWFTGAFMIVFAFMPRHRRLLLPAFLAVFVIYSTIGFRFRVLIIALAPIVYYYLAHRRRPSVTTLLAGAVVAALVIGGIGSIRTKVRSAAAVSLDELSLARAEQSFSHDLDIYQPFLTLVENMPDPEGFVLGRSFSYIIYHPIPRRIWEGKPEPPVHVIIRRAFGGNEALEAGVAYPNVGEYYANFGVGGVIAGMLLFGIFLRWLWEYTRLHVGNPWVRCIYGIALPFLVVAVSRGYLVFTIQSAAFFVGPVLMGMWVTSRRARARRPARREPAEPAGVRGLTSVT